MYILLIVLVIIIFWYIKKTNEHCPQVFKVPKTSLFIPMQTQSSNQTADNKEGMQNNDIDPLNDRINNHYMKNPYFIKKPGMGDIVNSYWRSDSSQPQKSDDGRLNDIFHAASDTVTPSYRNTIAAKTHDLYAIGNNKSRINNFEFEGGYASSPLSKYRN